MIDARALPGPEWLPGLSPDHDPENHVDGRTAAGATYRVPQLSDAESVAVAEAVRSAALAARRTHRTADVVVAAARAAGRLVDPDDGYGRAARDALEAATGCSRAAAAELLERNAAGWSAPVLSRLVRSEFGELAVLDEPRPDPGRPGRRRRAAGPPVAHLVLAGNVPGVAVTAVLRALVVRSGVLCKLPSSEPWLIGLFARALDEEDPALAATLAATWWPTAAPGPIAHEWIKRSGKVIVYGGPDAVRALRARTPPATPLVEYGPRAGAVILGPGTTDTELAGLARDTCAYDQAGCVSPRLVYLLGEQSEAEVDAFLARLGDALSAEGARLAPLFTTDEEAVEVRAARARYQFEAADGARALGPADLAWTILFRSRAAAHSQPLPRVLWAYAIAGLEELAPLRGVLEGRLQALGLAGLSDADRHRAEKLAVELGVSRVSPPGAMAWPPADWRHDGRMQLMPLVRWTDLEPAKLD
ncbi:MAG: acyl-CoA reductase [Gemmatimonadota bacterium]